MPASHAGIKAMAPSSGGQPLKNTAHCHAVGTRRPAKMLSVPASGATLHKLNAFPTWHLSAWLHLSGIWQTEGHHKTRLAPAGATPAHTEAGAAAAPCPAPAAPCAAAGLSKNAM